ncbi:siderophore non-ribosomal peptide synthetase [Burkholderia pseudomallei 1106b]|nr:siderophore non-ribosomal peptide synthetase [Burkholderia pseudomallei 1106b]
MERVKPPRSTAHPPLFQVMFVWQNMPAGELTIPGLTIRAVETPLQTAQFELTLSLQEAGDDIVGHLNYASALFDESTVRRYVTYWCRLLEGMTAGAADQTIVGLPLLDEAERKQVVSEWNATERDYPIEQCIHQLFEAQVDRKPEAIALTFDGRRLSYAELNARANRLAHYLQGRGVGPDRLVALCAERGIEMVVGLLAILKAGGAYVPLDPAYASDRLRGIVEDSQPALVLADAVGRAALGELDGALPVIDLETDALRWREMPATNPEVASQHVHHLAYVIYTSGSTGRPKGVMVEHAQVVRLFGATQAWFGFDERDVWTLFHSYGFDFSVWEMWGALLHGGRLVIVPTEVTRTPVGVLCAAVRGRRDGAESDAERVPGADVGAGGAGGGGREYRARKRNRPPAALCHLRWRGAGAADARVVVCPSRRAYAVGEHVWNHRDDGARDVLCAASGRRHAFGCESDRRADSGFAAIRAGRSSRAGADGRDGRAVCGRGGCRTRVLEPAGADAGAVHRRSVRGGWAAV